MPTLDRPITRPDDLRGRRTLVLGLARSGIAAARFLADAGAEVTVYDRLPASELTDAVEALEGRAVRLALGVPPNEVLALLATAELVVTSPSVSPRFPTTDEWLRSALADVEARGALISEVELFLRLTTARIAAVTGTKGKTTTASLLAAMLEAGGVPHALGGNIGQPLIQRATSLTRDDWAVLELSELQLPTISRGADLAIYTNIGADHLDRHGTREAYRAVKARLAELSDAGTVILNADDPGCRELGARLGGHVRWYGFSGPALAATVVGDDLVVAGERVVAVREVPLPGRHMRSNVLAAALAASLIGVGGSAIGAAIRAFKGVPHRLETIATLRGVRFVNDSMATIPDAAIAALEAFEPGRVVLIAGGQGKGLDYSAFADTVAARCRELILIGETADELERLIAGRVPVRRAASMEAAVAAAAGLAEPGEVVLLAPAATSFDMFADYAARGDAFRAAVEAGR